MLRKDRVYKKWLCSQLVCSSTKAEFFLIWNYQDTTKQIFNSFFEESRNSKKISDKRKILLHLSKKLGRMSTFKCWVHCSIFYEQQTNWWKCWDDTYQKWSKAFNNLHKLDDWGIKNFLYWKKGSFLKYFFTQCNMVHESAIEKARVDHHLSIGEIQREFKDSVAHFSRRSVGLYLAFWQCSRSGYWGCWFFSLNFTRRTSRQTIHVLWIMSTRNVSRLNAPNVKTQVDMLFLGIKKSLLSKTRFLF